MTCPTTLPSGVWTADPHRSRIGYSAGPDGGTLHDYEASLVVDGEFASLVAQVHGARFASTDIRREGDHLEVDGAVTIGDRTLAVTGCGTAAETAGALVLTASTVVDRRQFGIDWPPAHEVTLGVHLTFVKEPS